MPPPDSVTIEGQFDFPGGGSCFQKTRLPLPPCTWVDERGTGVSHTASGDGSIKTVSQAESTASAMLVFPNPASGDVTISYDYGSRDFGARSLEIYDAMGRKMDYTVPQGPHGSWVANTANWAQGIYIIRMVADGKALQIQRVVIVH